MRKDYVVIVEVFQIGCWYGTHKNVKMFKMFPDISIGYTFDVVHVFNSQYHKNKFWNQDRVFY